MGSDRRYRRGCADIGVLTRCAPGWARVALHVPVVRTWARDWLWGHGYFAPPQAPPGWGDDGTAGDREPRRPRPSPPSLTVALPEPD